MHRPKAILVSALIKPPAIEHFLQDHLDDPVSGCKADLLRTSVGQAKRQLTAESRIHESPAEEDTAAGKRGTAPEGCREISGEFHPLDRGDESAHTAREYRLFGYPEVIGRRLLGCAVIRLDDEIAVLEPARDFAGREDHCIE